MRDLQRITVMGTFGITDPTSVTWNRSCVSDILVPDSEYEGCTVLKPKHLKAVKRSMYTLSPYLLFLGATHTVVCEPGDEIKVFVPAALSDIPEDALRIRGYSI